MGGGKITETFKIRGPNHSGRRKTQTRRNPAILKACAKVATIFARCPRSGEVRNLQAAPFAFRLLGGQRRKLRHELLDRFVPSDLFELARAARARTRERSLNAVRMIGHLQSGLSARAELALIDRVRRDSLRAFSPVPFSDRPSCPLRTTSASPCITRTSMPQPAGKACRCSASMSRCPELNPLPG